MLIVSSNYTRYDEQTINVEVRSGNESRRSGRAAFLDAHPGTKRLLVGGRAGACSVEDFLMGRIELFYR